MSKNPWQNNPWKSNRPPFFIACKKRTHIFQVRIHQKREVYQFSNGGFHRLPGFSRSNFQDLPLVFMASTLKDSLTVASHPNKQIQCQLRFDPERVEQRQRSTGNFSAPPQRRACFFPTRGRFGFSFDGTEFRTKNQNCPNF